VSRPCRSARAVTRLRVVRRRLSRISFLAVSVQRLKIEAPARLMKASCPGTAFCQGRSAGVALQKGGPGRKRPSRFDAPGQQGDLVSPGGQLPGQGSADKAGPAGDKDFHGSYCKLNSMKKHGDFII